MTEPDLRPPDLLQRVAKPCSVRRLGPVDVAALPLQVARLSEKVWQREDMVKENDYFCFAHTRHIVFRFIPTVRARAQFYSRPLWRVWRACLLPVMAQAAAPYGFRQPVYPKAMLARLAAGRGIDPHVDGGGMDALVHKIHVPLQTNPLATLTAAGATAHLESGYAYEVNNLAPHGAFNGGSQDRIHFIFEVFEGAGLAWREQPWEDPATKGGFRFVPHATTHFMMRRADARDAILSPD